MIVLSNHEAEEVGGGFLPVVLVAAAAGARVAAIAAPYMPGIAVAAGGAMGTWGADFGAYLYKQM